ncbi:hypothetical protein SLS64_006363 [Diaporthe eres]
MAVWETEDERSGPARPVLSTAMDAQRPRSSRTPSRGSKRSSRRSVTPPGKIASSPPPMPGSDKTDKSDRVSKDIATDNNISILDPRRFTPTLHANLVSEILNLRRDQEEKLKLIESLESTLQTTRDEEDSIQTTLVSTAKENRSLKRQLALLEGGTSSALGELARERDEAVEAAAESRKRLEAAQKKLKTQEDDSGRTHDQWAKEKDDWDEERRKMERKLHVAETRLKTILEEVAAFHDAQANAEEESGGEDKGKDKDSDAGSVRSMSIRESLRFSLMNKANGYSLADELDFDDDSDYQTDPNGRDSVMSARKHARNDSRASILSKSHRRHRSSESFIRPGSVARGKFQPQMQAEGNLANGIIQEIEEPPSPAHAKPKVSYTDTGVQYSPPPSPKLQPGKPSIPEPSGVTALAARWEKHHEAEATEANQRRKRVAAAARPLSIQAAAPQSLMVSTSAQTVDVPLSPPKTPKTESLEPTQTPKPKPADMVSATTQTDTPVPPPLLRPVTPPVPAIPSIAIHPPKSRPSTPKKSLLPQLFKDFGCQVSMSNVPMSSSGVQTEEIRIDQRLDRLPAHLHPSAINSRPTSPAQGTEIPNDPDRHFTPVPGNLPPRNPRRLTSQRSIGELATSARMSIESETKDAYPGNNDDGPVSQKAAVRRPHRISSLFAGFDAVSSADEADDFADADMSDTEYRTALSAPRPVKTPEPGRSTPGSVPSSPEEVAPKKSAHKLSARQAGKNEIPASPRLADSPEGFGPARKGSKGHIRGSGMGGKSGGMRKAAMIQNGITTHTHQEDAKDPPFPIPTRASSRKPLNGSAPSDGNRSPTRNEPWKKNRMPLHRANSLRKSRSGAAGHSKSRGRRQNSRSPPYTPDLAHDPSIPPLPRNQLTTPKNDRGRARGHSHHPSTNTATTEATGFQSNASTQPAATTVVDAIAQTMVGEWMFKYVRRRKSFGVANDNVGKDDSSNDRHKRWVWLAPYERAILWSSKQPSSGSALLGKSGRKRRSLALSHEEKYLADSAPVTIQSVLDVKDDNPPPKGHTVVFNRSILILTPQRALKFTAVNAEPASESVASGYSNPSNPSNQSNHTNPGQHSRDWSGDAAEPPFIPRFQDRDRPQVGGGAVIHGRKRSNTGGHVPPPLSFRGFSGPTSYHAPTNSQSTGTGSSEVYSNPSNNSHSTPYSGPASAGLSSQGWGGMSVVSGRTSEASNRTSGANFFDAIGTVRMEAFISPLAFSQFGPEADNGGGGIGGGNFPDPLEDSRYRARRRSKEIRRRRSRSRQRDSYSSRGARSDYYSGSRTAGEEEYMRDDPFKGF